MTKQGEKLVGINEEQLLTQLCTERDPKAIKRLVVALEYKSGLSPAKIQHKYGWHEQTVYDWLDIVAERDAFALGDLPRGGSQSRLTDDQWEELTATLAESTHQLGNRHSCATTSPTSSASSTRSRTCIA